MIVDSCVCLRVDILNPKKMYVGTIVRVDCICVK